MLARSALTIVALALFQVACSPTPSRTVGESAPPAGSDAPSGFSTPAPSSPTEAAGWRLLEPSGAAPAAREDHTWTVAPDGSAYLFGGRDGSAVHDDLWAYDLATNAWRQVADAGAGPPARFGHNAVWAPGIGLVVFAGQGPAGFFNDLWTYDPIANVWAELPASGAIPVSRYGSCAAIGPDGRLWISHGFTSEGQRFADTRAFDFATAAWTDETPVGDAPIKRCLHACWWTDDGGLILYAGQTTGTTALGDLWRLAVGERPGTNAWTQLTAEQLPPDRNLYAAARWESGTLVLGGQGVDGGYLDDTWWISDAATAQPLNLGGAPSPRSGAELVSDAERGRFLLFGGRDGDASFAELWQLVIPALP